MPENKKAKSIFEKIAEWIAGLTAVVLALVGLKVALQQLFPNPPAETIAAAADNQAADSTADFDNLATSAGDGGQTLQPESETAAPDQGVVQPPVSAGSDIPNVPGSDGSGAQDQGSVTPAAPPLPTSYSKPNGHIREGDAHNWHETDETNGLNVTWIEQSRSGGLTVLYDPTRKMYMRFPNNGGQVEWSYFNPVQWTPLYFVTVDQ